MKKDLNLVYCICCVPFINIIFFSSDYAMLHFYVEVKDSDGLWKIQSGLKVINELKGKLKGANEIISMKFLKIDTLVCQNECSGHGYCRQDTRTCVCESFWIENFVRRGLMDGKSNCGKISLYRHYTVTRMFWDKVITYLSDI